MSEAMKYKLPPLPPQSSKVFRTAIGPVEVLAYTAEQMQAYAIAAIEAQGVPDGWQLVPKEPTDVMVRAALHLDLSYMPGHDGPDRAAVYKAMLASAPPAPQAKPQPLLSSEIWDNDAIMEVNADAQLPYELIERFVRAIEAAHGITKE